MSAPGAPDQDAADTGGAEHPVHAIPASPSPDDAAALVATLRALPSGQTVRFDASAVEVMCTPYVLAIISTIETNLDVAPPVSVSGATTPFIDAFSDLGFFQEMMRMEFVT